jgi:hypothetical protein
VVEGCGAEADGGEDESDVHAGVVVLAVVVDDCADEIMGVEGGEGVEGCVSREDVGWGEVFAACEDVVEFTAGPVVRDLPVPFLFTV